MSSGLVTLYNAVGFDAGFTDAKLWLMRPGSWDRRFLFVYDLHGLVLGVQENPVVKLGDVSCCEPVSNILYGYSCSAPPGILAASLKDLHQHVKGHVPVKASAAVAYIPGDQKPYQEVESVLHATGELYSASFLYPALSFRRDCTLYVEV